METCNWHYESGGKCNISAPVNQLSAAHGGPLCDTHWAAYMEERKPYAPAPVVERSILLEAEEIINGERQKTYGPPKESFERIGRLWQHTLDLDFAPSAEQVALCLIQLKVSRAVGNIEQDGSVKRDTIVDIAGYAGCIELFGKEA